MRASLADLVENHLTKRIKTKNPASDEVTAKTLFKVLKRRITADQASPFLDALVEDAALYRAMNEPEYGKWAKEEKEIARALSALVTLRVVQQTPCVLSVLREYRVTKKLKKKHVEEAIVAIEKFHFLFTAVTSQRSSGGVSEMYAALGRRLFEAKDTNDAVKVIRPSGENFPANSFAGGLRKG
jgi:hypothetical protein